MSQSQTCPVCMTEYRVTWHPMIEHEASQTCFCGCVLARWSGTKNERFDMIDKYGTAKVAGSKSH